MNSKSVLYMQFLYTVSHIQFIFLIHFINCPFYNSLCPTDPTLAPSRAAFNLVQIHHRNINHQNFQYNKKDQNPTNRPRNSCLVFHEEEEENSLCQRSDYQSPTTNFKKKLKKLCKLLLAFVIIFLSFLFL